MKYLHVDGCSFTWGLGLDNPQKENWGAFLGNKLELSVRNYSMPGQGNDEMFRKVYELFYLPNNLPNVIVIQLSELTRIRIFDDITMEWKSANPHEWDLPKKTYDYYWKHYYSVYQNLYYLFVHMLLLKDKCDSLGIEFYVFDGICKINSHCLGDDPEDSRLTKLNILPQKYLYHHGEYPVEKIQRYKTEVKLLDLYQTVKDKNFLLYNGDNSWAGKVGDLKKDDEWWNPKCYHPTKESHEFIANEIYNFIKESK